MAQTVIEARSQGFEVTRTKRRHYKFVPPGGGRIIYTSGTPSDWRSYGNFIADLRRVGYKTKADIEIEGETIVGINPLGEALQVAMTGGAEVKVEKGVAIPMRGTSTYDAISEFLARRGRDGATTTDIHAYIASTREKGMTLNGLTNALARMADRGQIVRQSRGGRSGPARFRSIESTPAPTAPRDPPPAIPVAAPPAHAAPAPPDAAPYVPAGRTGDPAIDKDIDTLEGALAALAQIEGVVVRNRDILVQFAKLKAMLNLG